MMASVFVVGGSGYIGSHMVKSLLRAGYDVAVFDNLSTGHRDALVGGEFIHGDLLDRDGVARALASCRPDLVMHFAASAHVGESASHPRKYYANNVNGTLNLMNAMVDLGIPRFIFSSTCATYGTVTGGPITEEHPQRPINTYGNTKLACELAMADYGRAYRLNSVALRYFNAAGCDREGDLDERHDPETHLIPLVLREAARLAAGGARDATRLAVYGNDYPTPDGTCIRDYIHVEDLCRAHLLAGERLLRADTSASGFEAFNLGNGGGSSVLEVIAAVRRVTGVDFAYRIEPRRRGDPPVLLGSSAKAAAVLGWEPVIPELTAIVASAWRAMQRTAGPRASGVPKRRMTGAYIPAARPSEPAAQ
jgi:UDP-glucose 4-epimerase